MLAHDRFSNTRAFSLVELSIVLVILGLLVGGVLSGQSLIRASELRAVTTEYETYMTALHSFRDKYFGMPGDITNATLIWGKDNTNCSTNTGTAATNGTCNGNGDGAWGVSNAGLTAEDMQLWKQLALAGMLEGSFTGITGPGGPSNSVPGTNVPRSKVGSTNGWYAANAGTWKGDGGNYAIDYGNYLELGGQHQLYETLNPILKPEEAWNIDTKIDDGKPGTGIVVARYWNNSCATGGTDMTDVIHSVYKLTDSTLQCALYFVHVL